MSQTIVPAFSPIFSSQLLPKKASYFEKQLLFFFFGDLVPVTYKDLRWLWVRQEMSPENRCEGGKKGLAVFCPLLSLTRAGRSGGLWLVVWVGSQAPEQVTLSLPGPETSSLILTSSCLCFLPARWRSLNEIIKMTFKSGGSLTQVNSHEYEVVL